MITQFELHQILNYDPQTGVFMWVDPGVNGKVKPGDRAGSKKKKKFTKDGRDLGYRVVKIGAASYAEHRLAWLYMTGEWPEDDLDHKDRVRDNNKFDNLRQATRKQNAENRGARFGSLSGFRGVCWHLSGKWHASIMHFGKSINLGYFDDIEQAKDARLKAERELFTHSMRI